MPAPTSRANARAQLARPGGKIQLEVDGDGDGDGDGDVPLALD